MFGNTRNHRPPVDTRINFQFQQFFGFGYFFRFEDGSRADIHFHKIFVGNFLFLRSSRGSRFVGLFGIEQFLYLFFHFGIFYFLKQKSRFSQRMALQQKVGTAGLFPFHGLQVQHAQQFFCRERQKRFRHNGKVSRYLQRKVQDGFHPFGVGFKDFPRLVIGEVFVAQACQVHHFAQRFAKAVPVEAFRNFCRKCFQRLQCFGVDIVQGVAGRHFAIKIFFGEHQRTVHKIAENGQ